jgi:type II secretory pathway pseudopilin PulG
MRSGRAYNIFGIACRFIPSTYNSFLTKYSPYNNTPKFTSKNAAPAFIPKSPKISKKLSNERKSAFTLIELLVYMAILGFVVVVAGRAFSDATKMRVRSQNMIISAEEVGRVMAFLKDDISQMGTKNRKTINNITGDYGKFDYDIVDKVYINYTTTNAADLSSFVLKYKDPTEDYDILTFLKAHYTEDGLCRAVFTVKWSVTNDGTLIRECTPDRSAPGCNNGPNILPDECPERLIMASNLTQFKLLPSKPGKDDSHVLTAAGDPPDTVNFSSLSENGVNVNKLNIKDFEKNEDETANFVRTIYFSKNNGTSCYSLNFRKDEVYAIEFDQPYIKPSSSNGGTCYKYNKSECEYYNKMSMFQPGRDHLSVGLRNGGKPIVDVPDFLFYPPQSGEDKLKDNTNDININNESKQHFEFSVPVDVAACVGITAAFYSEDAVGGYLSIDKMRVIRKTDNVYRFEDDPDYPANNKEKASVKAFKLSLGVKKKNEIKLDTAIIAVPNNGVRAVAVGGS